MITPDNSWEAQSFALRAAPISAHDDEDMSFLTAVQGGWKPKRGSFAGVRDSKTRLPMADTNGAVMPDGGLSPCIIKVVGVGGGGCNAVSLISPFLALFVVLLLCVCVFMFSSCVFLLWLGLVFMIVGDGIYIYICVCLVWGI
jgi:hypothetical protein